MVWPMWWVCTGVNCPNLRKKINMLKKILTIDIQMIVWKSVEIRNFVLFNSDSISIIDGVFDIPQDIS